MIKKCIFLVCGLFASCAWANVSLTINGLDGELKANVDAYVSAISEEDYSTSLRFQSRLKESISTALKALGYYQPSIHFVIADDQTSLTVEIESGPPVLIEKSDIQLLGAASDDKDFLALVANSGLEKGAILNQQQIRCV